VTGAITAFAWCLMRNSSRGRVIYWLAVAAAVLTKGPVGIVLPGLLALAFLVSGREMARWRALWSWPAASAALLAVGGWYTAATLTGGREFLAVQLVRENVDRFAGRGEFAPCRAFAWHLMPRFFLGHLAPWHLAIADDVRRRRGVGAPVSAGGLLLHCWWLIVLAVFTVAAGKRAVYLLPLYPAIAVLAARALMRAFPSRTGRVAIAGGVVATALLMAMLSHRHLVRAGERSGLLPLARATTTLVPRTASLHASGNLPENDVLVLAYLLDRPLLRERVACGGARPVAYYLRPVPSGVPATSLERLAVFGGVELGRCPAS
jgi:4-amino-4-deoxy-L-arabinose transferase-like glycosyltransferase